jgi:hypothetical protein
MCFGFDKQLAFNLLLFNCCVYIHRILESTVSRFILKI